MGVHNVSQRWDVKWVAGKVLIVVLLLVTVSAENTTSESNHTIGVDTNLNYPHTWPVREFTNTLLAAFIPKYAVIRFCVNFKSSPTTVTTLFGAMHAD